MGQVHATEVDGVRTFWADSGRPTLSATLMFRVGAADETLATTGWLHLLEHLALHGLPRGTLAVNGSVSPLLTTFTMHGPPEQVVAALAEVTRRLAEPDLDELDRERRVLAAESATRGGPVQRAFAMRFGATGPGLLSYDDAALGRATPEGLTDLSRRAFCTHNAVLALDGAPPADLRVVLPSGARWAESPARPVERPRSSYAEPAGLVLSGLVGRTGPGTLVAPVVEDALRRTLREKDGTAYAPFSMYEAVDADRALVVAGTDVSPSTTRTLLATVIDLADDLAARGPDPASLSDLLAAMRQAFTDPYNVGYLSHRAAGQALRGLPLEQLEDILAELDATDAESLRPALTDFRDQLIAGVPPATAPHTRLPVITQPLHPSAARGVRSANWPADGSRLHVEDGAEQLVTVGNRRGHHRYRVDDVAGYLTWPDGARGLVLADGWSLSIQPDAWRKGRRLVARLDDLVPSELHLPQPSDTSPASGTQTAGMARRWSGGVRRWTAEMAGPDWLPTALGLLVVAVVAVVAVALGHPGVVGPLLLVFAIRSWLERDKDD